MLVFDAACSGTPVPNYQECITPESKAHKFCDMTLPAEDRLADLLQVSARRLQHPVARKCQQRPPHAVVLRRASASRRKFLLWHLTLHTARDV